MRVDGDDRFTEGRLAGWFDPPLVLARGYGAESFVAGPLVQAMREGRVLFVNELNRMPEPVQNVLLPALDEGLLQVPHLGQVRAAEGFQVVATQNPVEYVATGRLSEALRDRFERLALDYQAAAEETAIVAALTGCRDEALVRAAVRLTRATRLHPQFAKGASVRGAVAIVAIARRAARTTAVRRGRGRETLRRAAEAALTTRVDLRDDGDADLGTALDELLDLVVERGEDPDVAFAPAPAVEASGARRRGGLRRTGAGAAGVRRGPARAEACSSGRDELAGHLARDEDELDGWELAGALSSGTLGFRTERPACAQRLAAGAVLRRARPPRRPAAGRHARRPRAVREPSSGELAVEPTLENVLGKERP